MVQALELLTIDELEEAKKEAIREWDGLRYKQVFDALGLEEPDVQELYDKGKAEEIHLRKNGNGVPHEIRKGTKSETNYSRFLEETQRMHINTRSFVANIDLKKRLLEKYFPKRFGYKAKKPIIDYTVFNAGYVFNILLERAKEVVGQ